VFLHLCVEDQSRAQQNPTNSTIENGQTDTPVDVENQNLPPVTVTNGETPYSVIRKKELVKNRTFNKER
jgi:hypothetical protein